LSGENLCFFASAIKETAVGGVSESFMHSLYCPNPKPQPALLKPPAGRPVFFFGRGPPRRKLPHQHAIRPIPSLVESDCRARRHFTPGHSSPRPPIWVPLSGLGGGWFKQPCKKKTRTRGPLFFYTNGCQISPALYFALQSPGDRNAQFRDPPALCPSSINGLPRSGGVGGGLALLQRNPAGPGVVRTRTHPPRVKGPPVLVCPGPPASLHSATRRCKNKQWVATKIKIPRRAKRPVGQKKGVFTTGGQKIFRNQPRRRPIGFSSTPPPPPGPEISYNPSCGNKSVGPRGGTKPQPECPFETCENAVFNEIFCPAGWGKTAGAIGPRAKSGFSPFRRWKPQRPPVEICPLFPRQERNRPQWRFLTGRGTDRPASRHKSSWSGSFPNPTAIFSLSSQTARPGLGQVRPPRRLP